MGTTSQKAQGYMRKSKQAGNEEPHKDNSDKNSQFESGLLVKAEIKEQITHYTIRETGKNKQWKPLGSWKSYKCPIRKYLQITMLNCCSIPAGKGLRLVT